MPLLHTDFETFGYQNLPKVGLDRYLSDARTELNLQQWAKDDGPVRVEEPDPHQIIHPDFELEVRDTRNYIVAFNAPFERAALKYLCGVDLPPERFICTQALAYHFSYAKGLEAVGKQLELPENLQKMGADARAVMLKFARPRKPTKADPSTRWTKHNGEQWWPQFLAYAEYDVIASRAIWEYFSTRYPEYMSWWWENERPLWCLDQRCNEHGWPLDTKVVLSACEWYEQVKQKAKTQLDKFTGLANSNSRDQMMGWLQQRGAGLPNMQEETIKNALKRPDLTADVRYVMKAYSEMQKATPDKLLALRRAMTDGSIRYTLQFAGASRTNRWAGRLFQPQNLYSARAWDPEALDLLCDNISKYGPETLTLLYPDAMEALSACIRPTITAPAGYLLVVVDLSSIESRLLGWLADCERILRIFKEGGDTYRDLASRYFRVPIGQVTKQQRTFCKPPELGAGYRLAAPALVEYAAGMGVHLVLSEAEELIRIWRAVNPEVPDMWKAYEQASEAVTTRQVTVAETHKVQFTRDDVHLQCELPNGRRIFYRNPSVRPGKYRTGFHYMGRNDRGRGAFWSRREMHGGPWTENIDQAIARDVLAEALKEIDAELPSMTLVGHVHDEGVWMVPENLADTGLSLATEILSRSRPWAPGLQLEAEGHVMKRYKKL